MEHLARHAGQDPWSRLWLVVLEQALIDAHLAPPRTSESALFLDTVQTWFATSAFARVCELAGLHPEWVRRQLDAYRNARRRASANGD